MEREQSPLDHRVGEAFEEGIQLTVAGAKLTAGQKAPDFSMETLPPGQGMPSEVSLKDTAGKVRLLNVINSIDTPVCQCETRRWEELLSSFRPARARNSARPTECYSRSGACCSGPSS